MDSPAERYAKEPVRYPALQIVDLAAEGAAVTERYRNMVISRVNDSACGSPCSMKHTVGTIIPRRMSCSSL